AVVTVVQQTTSNAQPETVIDNRQIILTQPAPSHIPPSISSSTTHDLREPGAGKLGVPTVTSDITVSNGTYDPPGLVSAGWTDNGDGTFSIVGQYGSAKLDTTANTLTYTLTGENPTVLDLDHGHKLKDSFVVAAIGDGTSTATVNFTIDGVTHPVA